MPESKVGILMRLLGSGCGRCLDVAADFLGESRDLSIVGGDLPSHRHAVSGMGGLDDPETVRWPGFEQQDRRSDNQTSNCLDINIFQRSSSGVHLPTFVFQRSSSYESSDVHLPNVMLIF